MVQSVYGGGCLVPKCYYNDSIDITYLTKMEEIPSGLYSNIDKDNVIYEVYSV